MHPVGLGYGLAFVIISISWTIIADRAGRLGIKSTFGVLQAFLAAWTENKEERMEKISESKAHTEVVKTYIVKFKVVNSDEISIILPEVHPGPFNPVGGSNLPYVLYTLFSKYPFEKGSRTIYWNFLSSVDIGKGSYLHSSGSI